MTAKRRHARSKGKQSRTPRSHTQSKHLPTRQMPEYFKVLDTVVASGHAALSSAHGVLSPVDRMRLPVLDRAVMHLQAAQVLLKECHWESAAVVARQLFELLVNIEEVQQRSDPQVAWEEFTRYGIASAATSELAKIEYAKKQGYVDDNARASALRALLATPPYDTLKVGGRGWSGKSVKTLSKHSANPDRKEQYGYFYSAWSDQVHSNPSALMRAIEPRVASEAEHHIRQMAYSETRSLIVMLVSLFCDLIDLLGEPRLIPEGKRSEWREQLREANDVFMKRRALDSAP